MMTLPQFTKPNPNLRELWEEQDRLKKQADKLIKETGIFKTFSRYGTLSAIGGSYEYNLMVYPDLDIGLVSEGVDKQTFSRLVGELTASEYVRKIGTADGVNFAAVHKGRPKGYWVGLELPFEGDRWGIDCWVQEPKWVSGNVEKYTERLSSLDQTGRDAILLIKYDLIRRGLYGKTVFSGDVYDAVLDKGVRTVADFKQIIEAS